MTSLFGNAKRIWVTTTLGGTLRDVLKRYYKRGGVSVDDLIESGGVWLNQQRQCQANAIIPPKSTLVVYQSPTQGWHYQVTSESVCYQQDGLLVVFKPSGLSTVPDRACHRYNLTHAVGHYLNQAKGGFKPTAITRLDLLVSGLVLFGETPDAEKALFALMRDHQIRKLYEVRIACEGKTPPRFKRIRGKIDFVRRAVSSEAGRWAETWFFLRSIQQGVAIYAAVPITGRRHQIRYHATLLLGPIIGDDWYGGVASGGFGLRCCQYRLVWNGCRLSIRCPDGLDGDGMPPTQSSRKIAGGGAPLDPT